MLGFDTDRHVTDRNAFPICVRYWNYERRDSENQDHEANPKKHFHLDSPQKHDEERAEKQ
jgi:hypothetical protein